MDDESRDVPVTWNKCKQCIAMICINKQITARFGNGSYSFGVASKVEKTFPWFEIPQPGDKRTIDSSLKKDFEPFCIFWDIEFNLGTASTKLLHLCICQWAISQLYLILNQTVISKDQWGQWGQNKRLRTLYNFSTSFTNGSNSYLTPLGCSISGPSEGKMRIGRDAKHRVLVPAESPDQFYLW